MSTPDNVLDIENRRFRLAGLLVDPSANRIDPGGHDVHVEPRVMAVLVKMASEPGRTIRREEFLDCVWQDAPYVSDESLTKAVSELRKHLDACDAETEYVRTVPKKGYRLVVPVDVVGSGLPAFAGDGHGMPGDGAPASSPATSGRSAQANSRDREGLLRLERSVRRMKITAAAVIVLLLVGAGAWILQPANQQVRIRRVAVPAADVSPDSPLARVLSDTTFSVDGSAEEWLAARSEQRLLDGKDVGLRRRVPKPENSGP
jgi:DNA-binding winged helix-turn-helix (wHTH) protein